MVTPNKQLVTPANNSDIGTWDVPVNQNSSQIDLAFGGLTVLNAQSASGNVLLTLAQYTPPIIVITGTPAAAVNYQLPAATGGFYFVTNNAPGGSPNISFSSASGGASVTVPSQSSMPIVIDPTYGARRATTLTSPAGSNGQVQFNNNGAFGANGNITTDGSNFYVNGWTVGYAGVQIGGSGIQSTAGYQAAVIPVYEGITTPGVDYGTMSGTLYLDCRRSNMFKVTLNGNAAFAPQNPGDGQTINLFIQQDANGNHSMSWPGGSSFYLSGGVNTLSTGGYNIDLLVATYVGAWGVWMGSLVKGFQPQ